MDRTMDLSTLETGTPDASFEKLGRQVDNQGWPTFSLIHKLAALRQLEAWDASSQTMMDQLFPNEARGKPTDARLCELSSRNE